MRGTYFLGDTDVVRPSPQHPPCRYEQQQQQHSSASSKNGTMVVVVSAVALGQMLLLSRDGVRLSSRLTPYPLGLFSSSPAIGPSPPRTRISRTCGLPPAASAGPFQASLPLAHTSSSTLSCIQQHPPPQVPIDCIRLSTS